MAGQKNKRELILTQSPGKLMWSMSLPAIVGMVVIGLYTFVDAISAGQIIGVDAMGAVSIAYPFTFINSGMAAMIGMGSASVLSRAIGACDKRTIDAVMGNLIVMNLLLSLVVTAAGVLLAPQLLALTGAEGAMLDLATAYLRIIFVGSLFVNFAQSSNMIMRGEGELVRAMAIMGGGAVLNMVLAPMFILALRDQGLGIEGAACATVLSQAVQAAVMLWWFVCREKTARITRVALSGDILSEVVKVGVSAMLMQVLTLVQQAIIYRAAAEWGGAEWQVLFGAGLFERVRKATVAFCLGATGLSLLFWIPVMLAPEAVLSLFITDPAIVALGVGDFRIFFATYLAMGVMVMDITLLQALGRGGKAAMVGGAEFARIQRGTSVNPTQI